MSLKTETEINTEKCTGAIRFYANGEIVTEYTFADGTVTMSARKVQHQNDTSQYYSGIKDTRKWLSDIKLMCPNYFKKNKSTFTMNLNVDEKGINYTFSAILVNKTRKRERIITKAHYNKEKDLVTFYARPAVVVNVIDFQQAVDYTFFLLRLINQLKQEKL